MKSFKGTKGKWYANEYAGEYLIEDGEHHESRTLTSSKHIDEVKARANALLMSKAPEMLEMLIKVTKHLECASYSMSWEWYDEAGEIVEKAEKLIKKATEI